MKEPRQDESSETQSRSPRATLTTGPIAPTLRRLAGPMILGMVSIIAFNVVDTFFVGMLGTRELAAMSFTFPFVFVVGSITMGLSTGATSVISRAIGAGDSERVRRYTTDAIVLAVAIVAVVGAVGYVSMEGLFRLLGATDEQLPYILDYMTIWIFGLMFLIVPMVGNGAIRATGDTKTPAIIMIVAGGVNVALDPLLIFGLGPVPAMGISGAALATVLSRATTTVVALWVLWRREHLLTSTRPGLKQLVDSWGGILRVGLPAAGTNVIGPLSTAFLTALVATYGEEAVAAFGAASRVEALAIIVPAALGAALAPFAGQNWGAGMAERVRSALRMSERWGLLWGALCLAVFVSLASPIAGVFTRDPVAAEHLMVFLWIVPIGHGAQSVFMSVSSVFNALGRPWHAATLGVLRMVVFLVPLSYLGATLFGLPGVFAGMVAANLLVALVAHLWSGRLFSGGNRARQEARR